ncbi:MAG: hypothetical protein EPO07_04170 [Verrucomicrobia bacterium]|nr:MAG: hypothetical protein EPO07_04170 [Verrucomicrobiota bacterium]
MQKRRKIFRNVVSGVSVVLAVYVVAYILNSAGGGYWMIPSRDGHVRFKSEFGGLSMTVAIMWQPRFGNNALGQLDCYGTFFGPLILLDQAWIHPTHYLTDDGFDAWLKQLPPSKVHPRFREEFVRERTKSAV